MNTKDMKNDLFPPVVAKWFRYYLNELFLATDDGEKQQALIKTQFFLHGEKFSFCVGAQNSMGTPSEIRWQLLLSDLTGGLSRLLFNTLSLINLFAIVWGRLCVYIFWPLLFGQINYGPKLGSGLISNSNKNGEQNQCRIVTNFFGQHNK